ncbi:hypothetical protein [Pseudomonas sp. URMO17WK12:I11]|uniref:hypothetical protein n=1 Tax=Pseudomonas sp. URMO17WK12:I11 TaxID=1283291 RepID=UPI0011A06C7B|nr:hypothetical protein [Pseudomonas sp. URMO17WK12:I11]
MQRDWKYVRFVLEKVAESPRPFSTLNLSDLIALANQEFGDIEQTGFQIQATVLQLWYAEHLELVEAALSPEGLRKGVLKRLTWSGYDLLEARRNLDSGWSGS